MKRALLVLMCVFFLKANAQIPGPGDCTRARDRYADLNDHLLADRQDDSDLAPDMSQKWTVDITGFVTRNILARLADIGDADRIRAYLSCMQDDEVVRPWPELTNTPQVFLSQPGTVPLALTAMMVIRGGIGAPNTLPLVQCFGQSAGRWTLVATGSEQGFDGHLLYIHELRSPLANESWYLLSGLSIGGGGVFRMEVVACGAKQMRTVWERDGIRHGQIEVTDRSTILLTYAKQEDERTAAINGDKLGIEMFIVDDSGDPKHFSEMLHVTANGLER